MILTYDLRFWNRFLIISHKLQFLNMFSDKFSFRTFIFGFQHAVHVKILVSVYDFWFLVQYSDFAYIFW